MRTSLTLGIILLAATQPVAADAPKPSGVESLGNELLEDLAPNSFNPSNPSPPDQENPSQIAPRDSASRVPRFDDLGEDIGQPSGPLSLTRVRQGMQRAQSLLAANNAPNNLPTLKQADDVQQDVVSQLDKLIAELSKQCKSCNSQSSSSTKPKPSHASQSKPGKSANAAASGQTAARDSTDRLNSSTARPADNGDIEAVVKDLWGHLPERTREQMMQSFSEEFLPKYELEIEQYYRRLSEENEPGSSP
jgi:hypothetical protein